MGGEHLNSEQIRKSTYRSDYAVQIQDLVRDGYDRTRKRLTCKVACINDCMDPSKANCEWYVHPDFPHILLVISTKHIAYDEQLFISYGPDYWCEDRLPIHVLLAVVIGYSTGIDKSSEWSNLKAYKELGIALHDHKKQLKTDSLSFR